MPELHEDLSPGAINVLLNAGNGLLSVEPQTLLGRPKDDGRRMAIVMAREYLSVIGSRAPTKRIRDELTFSDTSSVRRKNRESRTKEIADLRGFVIFTVSSDRSGYYISGRFRASEKDSYPTEDLGFFRSPAQLEFVYSFDKSVKVECVLSRGVNVQEGSAWFWTPWMRHALYMSLRITAAHPDKASEASIPA